MSERSALIELASFIGRSSLASEDISLRRRTLDAMSARLLPRPRRSVGELLGAVLALSARTRRMAQPQASVDIDVFAPGGKRALRMSLGRR
jgi:hypothetical protein